MARAPIRLSKTQRLLLAFFAEGRAQLYTGVREAWVSRERDVAKCNLVSEYFIVQRGALRAAESNKPGRWFEITDYGRSTLECGKWVFD